MTDVDELIRRLRSGGPAMSERAFASGRERLLDAMASERAPRRARRRLLPVATAASIAVLAAGVVALSGAPATAPPASPPGTAEAPPHARPLPPLSDTPRNEAGTLGTDISDLPVPPGDYLYIEERTTGLHRDEVTRTWIPADRSGTWQRTTGDGTVRGPGGRFDTKNVGWRHPDAAFAAGLPRDARALYRQLAADQWPRVDAQAEAFHKITGLLAEAVPADLRRALYGALGYLPDVTVERGARTADGRPAVGVRIDERPLHRRVLLVGPETGLPIGSRLVQLVDARSAADGHLVRAGTVVAESTVRYAVVGQLGDKP
ncbi:hypothetical protein B0I33_102595 [Prauserella shujinwangii]|uniref:CU044_5270 family protein n=1 Tax=Prauserella shujinwangii TaxID=1453103 RepID=A0A2T0M1L8_9PSEU|nr:CU044_5270 family protein [Prauserella shujinwangii]PRX50473.1 hypothetical protein B0I33_102595 [Prauserella shujinwangii]